MVGAATFSDTSSGAELAALKVGLTVAVEATGLSISPVEMGVSPAGMDISPVGISPVGISPVEMGVSPAGMDISAVEMGVSPAGMDISPVEMGVSPAGIDMTPVTLERRGSVMMETTDWVEERRGWVKMVSVGTGGTGGMFSMLSDGPA
jgi:hypothetical protein